MTLIINGEPTEVDRVSTVADLLDYFRVSHQAVAVMANGAIVGRDEFAAFSVKDGDTLEIIRFVGGG
ncbi:MAG: sulfur carrier protein ThiS [Firmicutes bacterium]|nr:sulfur carrier protein ThiS [Bacillota bacterium]